MDGSTHPHRLMDAPDRVEYPAAMTDPDGRGLRRGRLLAFSVLVPAVVLGGLHLWAERQGRGPWLRDLLLEDVTLTVVEPLLERDGDGWRTTAYADINAPRGRLDPHSGKLQILALGGSFLFGDPYGAPGIPPQPGGIPWWLEQRLGDRGSVLNLAGMGDASSRVAAKAELLADRVDVLLVATGNNEYPIAAPSPRRQALRQHALVRRLGLLMGEKRERDHPPNLAMMYATGPSVEALRANFRRHLERVAAAGAAHDVPVLLATLPNNLWWALSNEGDRLTAEAEACVGPLADALRANPASPTSEWVARAAADPDTAPHPDLVGGALAAVGRTEEAVALLQRAAESRPLLIRPSFNAVVREVAAAHAGVHLVDLEARARAEVAPDVPGPGLFVDVCHLHWRGYRAMADEVADGLVEGGLVGGLDPAPDPAAVGLEPIPEPAPLVSTGLPWGCPAEIPAP